MLFLMMKKIFYTTFFLLFLLLGGLYFASDFMFDYSLRPAKNRGRRVNYSYHRVRRMYPEINVWMDSLRRSGAWKDVFVMRPGGRYHALRIDAPRQTNRVAILVHGYGDSGLSMLMIGKIYADMGFNILLPDLNNCGRSPRNLMHMGGGDDQLLVRQWMAYADSLWKGHEGATRQVLHGVSMGAATVMTLSGGFPEASLDGMSKDSVDAPLRHVVAFVEDCGYTSTFDEFSEQLDEQFSLPPFPLLYTTSLLSEWRNGWDFRDFAPIDAVRRCAKPMLFIHGSRDTFVPTRMVHDLFRAKPAPKQFWIAPGSKHARSYRDHRKEYARRVREFLRGV